MVKLFLCVIALGVSSPATAGSDADQNRAVAEGAVAFAQEGVEAGETYEGFLIAFPERSEVYLSPSRYRVTYIANALQCRNADQFSLASIRDGRWWKVVFEVLAVKESAVEDPPGSGKWAWRTSYDCVLKDLQPAR